jgi:hypothetical protein
MPNVAGATISGGNGGARVSKTRVLARVARGKGGLMSAAKFESVARMWLSVTQL